MTASNRAAGNGQRADLLAETAQINSPRRAIATQNQAGARTDGIGRTQRQGAAGDRCASGQSAFRGERQSAGTNFGQICGRGGAAGICLRQTRGQRQVAAGVRNVKNSGVAFRG